MYNKNDKDPSIKKRYISARTIAYTFLVQSHEVGREYEFAADNVNTHTPFKDKIYSSNLCVAGNTMITVCVDNVPMQINMKECVEMVNSMKNVEVLSKNIDTQQIEYKPITAAAVTGKSQQLYKITDSITGKSIRATANHLIFTKTRGYVRVDELRADDELDII